MPDVGKAVSWGLKGIDPMAGEEKLITGLVLLSAIKNWLAGDDNVVGVAEAISGAALCWGGWRIVWAT